MSTTHVIRSPKSTDHHISFQSLHTIKRVSYYMHNIDVRQSRVEQIPGLWQEDQFSEHLLSIGWCGRRSCDAQECTVGGGRVGGKGEGGWE